MSSLSSPSRLERWIFAALLSCTFALALMHVAVAESERDHAASSINPFADSRLGASETFALEGDVVRSLDAGSYVYFELVDANGAHHWVVSLTATSPVRARRIGASILGRAHDFPSVRVGRRFETLLFGIVRDVGRDGTP